MLLVVCSCSWSAESKTKVFLERDTSAPRLYFTLLQVELWRGARGVDKWQNMCFGKTGGQTVCGPRCINVSIIQEMPNSFHFTQSTKHISADQFTPNYLSFAFHLYSQSKCSSTFFGHRVRPNNTHVKSSTFDKDWELYQKMFNVFFVLMIVSFFICIFLYIS